MSVLAVMTGYDSGVLGWNKFFVPKVYTALFEKDGITGEYKTFEKQEVFRERAMDGDSVFYTPLGFHPSWHDRQLYDRSYAVLDTN